MDQASLTFLVIGLLAALGYVGNEMFRRTRIPDVLLLMLVGVLIGPVLHLFPDPTSPQMINITNYFGILAMIFILFDGGLELDFDVMLSQAGAAMGLLVVSLVTCLAGLACAFHYMLEWPWIPALTLAAILANISGAIVLPVVQQMRLPEGEKTLLKLEAAGSDVLVIIILISLVDIAAGAYGPQASSLAVNYQEIYSNLLSNFAVALFLGGLGGIVWVIVLNRVHGTQHYYIFTLGAVLILYSITQLSNASGPMAVLAFGMIISNANKFLQFINKGPATFTTYDLKKLHSTFSFFVRTFFLIYVGLFLSEKILNAWVLIVGFLILVIVIVTRFISAQLFGVIARKNSRARNTYFFMLPRGLAVAVLAILPLSNIQQTWKPYLSQSLAVSAQEAQAVWDTLLRVPPDMQNPVWTLLDMEMGTLDRQKLWDKLIHLPKQEQKAYYEKLASVSMGSQTAQQAIIWRELLEQANTKTNIPIENETPDPVDEVIVDENNDASSIPVAEATAEENNEAAAVPVIETTVDENDDTATAPAAEAKANVNNNGAVLQDKDAAQPVGFNSASFTAVSALIQNERPLFLPDSDGKKTTLAKEMAKIRPYLVAPNGKQVAGKFPLYAALMIFATNIFLTIGVFILERGSGPDDDDEDDGDNMDGAFDQAFPDTDMPVIPSAPVANPTPDIPQAPPVVPPPTA